MKIFLIYLSEFRRQLKFKLYQTVAERIRTEDIVKFLCDANKKLVEKVEVLNGKINQKQSVFDDKINVKKQQIQKLKDEMVQMKTDFEIRMRQIM